MLLNPLSNSKKPINCNNNIDKQFWTEKSETCLKRGKSVYKACLATYFINFSYQAL